MTSSIILQLVQAVVLYTYGVAAYTIILTLKRHQQRQKVTIH
jgi:hypothetical protein